jgi:hypothetical protein
MRCLAAALLLAPTVASAMGVGLCAASETSFFSCPTATKKWIGLCGSETGAVQYRFGTPGRIEFRYPANPADATDSVSLTHYGRFQVERLELTFSNRGVAYTLFDYVEAGKQNAGVRVATIAGKEHEIPCVGPVVSRLPKLRGVLRCDPDNALSLGECR